MIVAMEKRTKIIIGIAGFLTLVTLAIPSRQSKNPPPPAPVVAPEELSEGVSVPDPIRPVDPESLAEQKSRMEMAWGESPFVVVSDSSTARPMQVKSGSNNRLVLNGLSQQGKKRWAVIGTEIVQVGERLSSGHRVIEISSQQVTLAKGEKQIVLTLGQSTGENG